MSKLVVIKLDKHNYKKLLEDEVVYLVSNHQAKEIREFINKLRNQGLK